MREMMSLMKDAGCRIIEIGIESGNNDLLSKMKKNITIEQTFDACNLIKKHNIELHTFFLVGYPLETEETLRETVRMMKKRARAIIYITAFLLLILIHLCFIFAKKNGLIDENHDPTMFNHQSPQNCFSLYITPERFRKLAGEIEKWWFVRI